MSFHFGTLTLKSSVTSAVAAVSALKGSVDSRLGGTNFARKLESWGPSSAEAAAA